MARRGGLTQARLRPPRIPRDAVEREALISRALALLDGRALTIAAGAGYGKTTLLAMTARVDPRPWAWCSCDSRLRNAHALGHRIAVAMEVIAPGFDAGLDLAEADADDLAERISERAYEMLAEDWVLVIDDVHLLPEGATRLLPALLDALPDEGHLLIAGREAAPLPAGKSRLHGVGELTEADLRFSDEEAAALVLAFEPGIPDAARARIVRDAEGWAAGLVLGASAPARAGDLRFEYLAEEVVGRMPGDVQDFLMRTALASRFDPQLAAHLSGVRDAAAVIDDLARRHLFITRVDSDHEWYRYHHLFQAFLIERFAERAPDALRDCHRSAAGWWERQGEPVEVVRHLIAADDARAAAGYLAPIVEELIRGPQAELVSGWLEQFGADVWSGYPELVAARAALLMNEARHEAAFAELERAIESFSHGGDHDRAAALTLRLQQAMMTAGTNPKTRIAAGTSAVTRIDRAAGLLPAARIMLACAHGYACNFDEALGELARARELPAYNDLFATLAEIMRAFYVDFWTGSAAGATGTIAAGRLRLADPDLDDRLGLRPMAEMLEAYLNLELGQFEAAVDESILDTFERGGMGRETLQRAAGWVWSMGFAGMERWDLVEQTLGEPPRPNDAEAATCYSHRYRVPAALLAAQRGDRAGVEANVAVFREEIAAFGPAFDRGIFLCDLSRAASQVGNEELARELARDAHAFAERIGSPWQAVRAAIRLDALGPGADAALSRALELTAEHALEPAWTRRDSDVSRPVLERAVHGGLGPDGLAERLLANLGPGGPDAVSVRRTAAWTASERADWTSGTRSATATDELITQARAAIREQKATPAEPERSPMTAFLDAAAEELERRGEREGAIECRIALTSPACANERRHRDVIRLLAEDGRVADALRQYHVCRASLLRAGRAAPSRETEELYATLLMARDHDEAASPSDQLTVVFTDIVGSTQLASRHGDSRWARLIADHEGLLGVHAGEFGGRVVKTQGDGAMLAFDDSEAALGFAVSVQRALAVAAAPEARLPIRIGVHTGVAVRHGDDLLGNTVIVAARLMDTADGGEIVVSASTRSHLGAGRYAFTSPYRVTLRGLMDDLEVAKLSWRTATGVIGVDSGV